MDFLKMAYDVDVVADKLQEAGLADEAGRLDVVADVLEAMGGMPGIDQRAIELAKNLGITLTPENAADIVEKYFKPGVAAVPGEVEAAMGRAQQLAMLAALLVSGFIGSVQAQQEPITVNTPFGAKTYSVNDLKTLSKRDPKTFAIIMEQHGKQSEGRYRRLMQRGRGLGETPSGEYGKATKGIEELSDDFGNSGRLITFTDGTKELKGDILHGGVSFRKKLEQRGEIMKGNGPYAQEGGPAVGHS